MACSASRSWLLNAVVCSIALLTCVTPVSAQTTSSKRGLCFTPNPKWPQDNQVWPRKPTSLTWYYNYQASGSPAFSNTTQDNFEFVPMLWGAPADTSDTTFLTTVKAQINKGIKISHVLGFNEPDGPTKYGGSDVAPSVAAQVWVKNIIPLQDLGVKVGLPACTGGWGGIPWMQQFLANCSTLISNENETKNCTYDFIPIHFYGNFEGLASHVGNWYATFNASIWVTEYNFDNQDLQATQSFFNMSSSFLDRVEYVERYSIFAAFRSSVSNIGANAAMLNNGGELTDVGAWYLGRPATGVTPTSGQSDGSLAQPKTGLVLASAVFALAALLSI